MSDTCTVDFSYGSTYFTANTQFHMLKFAMSKFSWCLNG